MTNLAQYPQVIEGFSGRKLEWLEVICIIHMYMHIYTYVTKSCAIPFPIIITGVTWNK